MKISVFLFKKEEKTQKVGSSVCLFNYKFVPLRTFSLIGCKVEVAK